MKRKSLSGWCIPLAIACGFGVPGVAAGDEHHTPLRSTAGRVYANGANIRQTYERPEPESAAVADAGAAPGAVSPLAATHSLLNHPKNRDRVQNRLIPVLRSQSRVRLDLGAGPNGAAALTGGEAASLHKFTYVYQYKDVPLWKYSTQSQIVHARNGTRRTVLLRERNAPRLDQLGETEATVATDDAAKVALGDSKDATRAALGVDKDNEPPHREIHVDAQGKPTLAWALVVRSDDRKQPFARRYWVAARGEPTVLAREDLIYHQAPAGAAAQQGRVTGNFFGFKLSPLDPPAKGEGLNDYTVVASPGTAVVTDTNGFFSVADRSRLNNLLVGPFCRVINDAGSNLSGKSAGGSVTFDVTDQEDLAQVSAFHWVSSAHRFVADFVAGHDDRLSGLPTHVNIDETCNAFFDPNTHTLNFFKAGDGCVNSAYCDVACHEFGHAVDDQFDGIEDGGYSEGFGDSLAILITRDNKIGRDFMGRGTVLRDAAQISTWPPQDPEVHEVGKIYGGFTWELTRQLLSRLGDENRAFEAARKLVLGAAVLNPKDTPDAVRLSFVIDRQNGSPFFKELAAAADSRKIPRPQSPGDADEPSFLSGNGSKCR